MTSSADADSTVRVAGFPTPESELSPGSLMTIVSWVRAPLSFNDLHQVGYCSEPSVTGNSLQDDVLSNHCVLPIPYPTP